MAYQGGPYGTGTNRPRRRRRPARRRVAPVRRVARTPYGGSVKTRPSVGGPRGSGSLAPQRRQHKAQVQRINRQVRRAEQQRARKRQAQKRALDRAPLIGVAVRNERRRQKVTRSGGVLYTPINRQGRQAARRVPRPTWIGPNTRLRLPKGYQPRQGALASAINKNFDKVAKPIVKGGEKAGLTILEQTARPIHAIAGSTRAQLRGENPLTAFSRGARLKDHYLFSDVLKEAGVKNKKVLAAGGFALDVAADPTTYLTFGTASVARKGLTEVARKKVAAEATTKALNRGASRKAANKAGRAAVAKAVKAPPKRADRGVTVGVRAFGKQARTSGRGSARVAGMGPVVRGRKLSAQQAAKRARRSKPVQVTGGLLRPGFRQEGVPEGEFRRVRQAQRTARSVAYTGQRAAQDRAVAYARALRGTRDPDAVIHAVETRTVEKLPKHEQLIAHAIIEDLEHAYKAERALGLVGERYGDGGYFPQILKSAAEGGKKGLPRAKSAQLGSSLQRKDRRTLAEKNLDEDRYGAEGVFTTDIPLSIGTRLSRSAVARGNAHLLNELKQTGRKLYRGGQVKEGEAVYEVSARSVPRKVSAKEANQLADEIAEKGARDALKGREFRVMNEKLVDHAIGGQIPVPKDGAREAMREAGRWYDRKLQGRFKTLVTVPNPQYHLTNLYGDLFNAYLADTRVLAGGTGLRSFGALRRSAKQKAARRTLTGALDPSDKGLKIRGKNVTYDELLGEAEKHGAINTGFIGRDLPEVLDAMQEELAEKVGRGRFAKRIPGARRVTTSRVGRDLTHPIQSIRDLSQYREDFVRLATFISARRRGMSPAQASDWVAKHHFDYGDLTEFEKSVLRRIFPFYTFTARNTPLQVEKLLTRPGKYANLEKFREEAQKASSLPEGYEGELTEYQQRGQPIPLPFAIPFITQPGPGGNYVLPKLPSTDLGRLDPSIKEQFEYTVQMLSPYIGAPAEYLTNHSTFFRGPIDELYQKSGGKVQDYAPAPGWFAEAVKATMGERGLRAFGISKQRARKGDKGKVWVWPKRTNYLYGRLGPAAGVAQRIGTAPNQQGQGLAQKLFGFGTGLNVVPFDRAKNKENAAYDERDRLDSVARLMRRQGRDRRHGQITREYRRVLDAKNRIERKLNGRRTGIGRGGWGSATGSSSKGGGWGSAAGTK